MFLPIATDRPRKRPTRVTYTLMAINAIIFIIQSAAYNASPDATESLLNNLALAAPIDPGASFRPWGLLTYQFLHADLMHILGNMLFLFVFGPPVEDRLTRIGFTCFYLLGGIIAGAAHITFSIHPVIGASGSVAAVTGAFLVLFPRTHIRILLFFFLIGVYSIPAWWFIAFAIAKDFIYQGIGGSNVAHLAHIAGYMFGAAVPLVLLWRRIIPREPYDLFTIGRQAKRRRDFKEIASNKKYKSPWQSESHTAPKQRPVRSGASEKQLRETRTQISRLLAESRIPAAAVEYVALLSAHPNAALPRDDQLRIANHLFSTADYTNAAHAYTVFTTKYANDREANHITLMLALISVRYLNDPIKARQLIDSLTAVTLPEEQARLRDTLRAETA